MPRYFFHTSDGSPVIDDVGANYADDAAARTAAIKYASDLVGDDPTLLPNDRDFRIEVADRSGALLFTIILLAIAAIDPK